MKAFFFALTIIFAANAMELRGVFNERRENLITHRVESLFSTIESHALNEASAHEHSQVTFYEYGCIQTRYEPDCKVHNDKIAETTENVKFNMKNGMKYLLRTREEEEIYDLLSESVTYQINYTDINERVLKKIVASFSDAKLEQDISNCCNRYTLSW